MGRTCAFYGCRRTNGLHSFPSDHEMAQIWLRTARRSLDSNTTAMYICNRHFSRECYSNYVEHDFGYLSHARLRLNPSAVPNPFYATPPKRIFREVACQTERYLGVQHHAAVQADVKPSRRSKATMVRSRNKSVACDTSSLADAPCQPLVPSTPLKRPRLEVHADDSSFHPEVTESTMYDESTSIEAKSQKMEKFTNVQNVSPLTAKHCGSRVKN